jgi:hypothetical protein
MHHTNRFYISNRIALLGLLLILAACGGKSDQEKACDEVSAGHFPLLNGIKCVFGATDNGNPIQSDSGAMSTAANGPSLADQVGEYEPNNSLNNANPIALNVTATTITGNLAFADDSADNFVFTPVRTGDYRVYLCADTCDHVLENSALDLMILDQSQTTIAATSLGQANEKTMLTRLYAGAAYYITVGTLGTEESYRLAIAENVESMR